jgi:predicted nucleotidyltransferase
VFGSIPSSWKVISVSEFFLHTGLLGKLAVLQWNHLCDIIMLYMKGVGLMNKIDSTPSIKEQLAICLRDLVAKYQLDLVVLFGSQASGTAKQDSDIDLAVFRRRGLSSDEEVSLLQDVSRVIHEPFDLVVLNKADPLLLYQVAVSGKPVYQESDSEFRQFQVRAMQRMNDARKFIELEHAYVERFLAAN